MLNTPTVEKSELAFLTFVIAALGAELRLPGGRTFDLLTKETDLLQGYLIPCYDTLHTFSRQYVVADIIEQLKKKGVLT